MNRCNNVLVGYKNIFFVSDFQFNFYSTQTSSKAGSFLTPTGAEGTFEGNDFNVTDDVFLFVAASYDRDTGYFNKHVRIAFHVVYADVLIQLLHSQSPL